MQILAIIPARGGSKGIPRKNLHPFLGKPLIYWSILAAQESTLIDRILVSTEDPEIAAIASELGAEVPFLRPASLATDDATDYPVIRDCVEKLETNEGLRPEVIVQLRPTSPLRPAGLIDEGIVQVVNGFSDIEKNYIESSHKVQAIRHRFNQHLLNNEILPSQLIANKLNILLENA